MTNQLMRGVGVIITNQEGNYLLHLRDNKTKNMPNEWCLIGGAVLQDELIENAVKREVKEETALDVTDITFFKKVIQNNESEISIFSCRVDEETQKMKIGEGEKLQFFSTKELVELINGLSYTNQYLDVLLEYLQNN